MIRSKRSCATSRPARRFWLAPLAPDEFILRPVRPEEFVVRVGALLKMRRYREEIGNAITTLWRSPRASKNKTAARAGTAAASPLWAFCWARRRAWTTTNC